MAVLYTKEKSKYGHLTGQIIIWPMEYEGNPSQGQNPKNLPAGYLKCDGSRYFAVDYPRLAAILGTGTTSKFIRKNLDGTNFDTVSDTQFMVPDFGSKYPEPTTGANAGVYNNIRKEDNSTVPQEISRSGIGIVAQSQIGDSVDITYTGNIVLPSQEIPIPGKPGYTYAGATHRTETVGIDEDMIHGHAHFGTFARGRIMTTQADGSNPAETNNTPRAEGPTGRQTASTINIEDWLDNTLYDNNSASTAATCSGSNCNPRGGGQQKCKAMVYWNPGAGVHPGSAFYAGCQPLGFCNTIYWNGCIEGGALPGSGTTNEWARSGCIINEDTTFCGGFTWGSADGTNTAMYGNTSAFLPPIPFGCMPLVGLPVTGGGPANACETQPASYVAGLPGVPVDWKGDSLADVLPLQSNDQAESRRCNASLEHVTTDTADLTQATDPTLHNHRIRIDKNVTGDHTYKVRTRASNVDPENLSTSMAIGANASASIDTACAPFIVMEYLIKI